MCHANRKIAQYVQIQLRVKAAFKGSTKLMVGVWLAHLDALSATYQLVRIASMGTT